MKVTHDTLPQAVEHLTDKIDNLEKIIVAPQQDEYITRAQASKLLKCHVNTLDSYVRQKKIQAYGIGDKVLFLRSEVMAAPKRLNGS